MQGRQYTFCLSKCHPGSTHHPALLLIFKRYGKLKAKKVQFFFLLLVNFSNSLTFCKFTFQWFALVKWISAPKQKRICFLNSLIFLVYELLNDPALGLAYKWLKTSKNNDFTVRTRCVFPIFSALRGAFPLYSRSIFGKI